MCVDILSNLFGGLSIAFFILALGMGLLTFFGVMIFDISEPIRNVIIEIGIIRFVCVWFGVLIFFVIASSVLGANKSLAMLACGM